MDLSPNDIRTYEFPSQMRGYDKEEVDNFLEQTAQALENVKQDNLKLSMEIDSLKSQIATLKEYEDTIKKAAIDARRNADETVEQAKKEAAEILVKAKSESEAVLGSKESSVKHFNAQIEQLKEAKRSFINELRKLIVAHQDMIDDIAQVDIKKDLSDSDTNIQVTESADITRDNMEMVADTSQDESHEDEPEGEQGSFDAPMLKETDDNNTDQNNIDPELAEALQKYQKPTTVSGDDFTPEGLSLSNAPQPGEFVETDKSAEDVPDGFIVGNEIPKNNSTADTDKVNVENSAPRPKQSIDLAEELDNVVATFEKEMDRADKS